ncbi:MAG: hypothetical protein ACP5HM_11030 [Anaerolineae bacterium]
MNASPKGKPLFDAEKAKWLGEGGAQELDAAQRALLLALARLETAQGRELTEVEARALEALSEQASDFDPQEITQAVRHVVEAPADPDRQTSWPELKRNS